MVCPDGCGSVLTVNLDPRAGKAWRLYARNKVSLYPSVWRDGGCGAHFVLWQDCILWCGIHDDGDYSPRYDAELDSKVFAALTKTPKSAIEIADALDEIPWEVERTLSALVRTHRAQKAGKDPALFALADQPAPKSSAHPKPAPALKRRRWWQVWARDPR